MSTLFITTAILMRRDNLRMYRIKEGEKCVMMEAELEILNYKLRSLKHCQQTTRRWQETRMASCNWRSMVLLAWFRILVSRTVRQVILNSSAFVTLLWLPGESYITSLQWSGNNDREYLQRQNMNKHIDSEPTPLRMSYTKILRKCISM